MCKAQCNSDTEKALCVYGERLGSAIPIDTALRTRVSYLDELGNGRNIITFITQELYSNSDDQIILIVQQTVIDPSPGGASYTTDPVPYSFGTCQRCPSDSFEVICQDSPDGYCCINVQVIEDACLKLKG